MNTKSIKEQVREELNAEMRRRYPNAASLSGQLQQAAFLDGMEYGMTVTMRLVAQAMTAGLEPDPTKQ